MVEKRFNPNILIAGSGLLVLGMFAGLLPGLNAPAATPAAAVPATTQATTAPKDKPLEGTLNSNGTSVTRDGDTIHIVGTSEVDGWNHWNGFQTDEAPKGDFTASVDFKVSEFSGSGVRLVYLMAGQSGHDSVGVYFQPYTNYRVQTWSPAAQGGSLRAFGDEAKEFHRFILQYDTAAQTASAWVDDKLVGRIKTKLSGAGSFWMVTNTEHNGAKMDVTFQNFKLVHELKEATPATPATTATAPATSTFPRTLP